MPGTISIRNGDLNDHAVIVANNIAMASESEGRQLDRSLIEPGVKQALIDASKARYIIAEIDGQVAGQTMLTLEWSDWRNGWFWWIQSVYVLPHFRRQGVYRAIHNYIRREARKVGNVCGIRLYVERENKTAIDTYAALGMSDAGYLLMEEDWSGTSS